MIFVWFHVFSTTACVFQINAETPLEKHTRGAAFFLLQTLLSFCDICSKMGRVGENGSEEVAVFYAKKAVEETKETEKALKVLGLAIE